MPGKVTRNEDVIEVSFAGYRGPDFMDLVAKVKSLPGRRYDPDRKVWQIPGDDPDAAWRLVHMIQPEVEPALDEWIKTSRIKTEETMTTPLPDDAELEIPWATRRASWQPEYIEVAGSREPFNGLMKHQRPAVDIAAEKRKLLLCDDMGGGKTAVAVSSIAESQLRDHVIPAGPKLIICPNSVKGTWQREIPMWLGEDQPFQVIDSTSIKTRHNQLVGAILNNAWVIVNWEQIRAKNEKVEILRKGGRTTSKKVEWMKQPLFEFPWLAKLDIAHDEIDYVSVHERLNTPLDKPIGVDPGFLSWEAVVADEIHRAKNRKSQQAKGLWRCRADDGLMLGLSGTPLMNDPSELWSILRWLWPHDYHERGANFSPGARAYWSFFEEYVEYDEGYFGKVITGVRNPDALRFELQGRLVRRTRRMMRLGTKGVRRIPVPLKLNSKQGKLYKEAEKAMWLEVEQAVKEGDEGAIRFAAAASEGNVTKMMRLPNGAARTVRLRQIMETPANLGGEDDSAVLDACVELVMDSRPNQWIVFTEFKPTTECLAERMRKQKLIAETYHGDKTPQERKELEDRYQRGEIDVLIGTMKAMREGVTLTAGFNQFWVSRDWVPDNNEQGESRQDRIGQTKQVLAWIAQPEDTVAVSKVEPINRLKEAIVRTVLPKDEIEEGGTP